jgi:hypothetical protein
MKVNCEFHLLRCIRHSAIKFVQSLLELGAGQLCTAPAYRYIPAAQRSVHCACIPVRTSGTTFGALRLHTGTYQQHTGRCTSPAYRYVPAAHRSVHFACIPAPTSGTPAGQQDGQPCSTAALRAPNSLKNKNQLDATYYFIVLLIGSTCFGHYYAHHQELTTIMLITTLVVSFLVCCMLGVRCG